ncbi:phage tail tape measure protein [Lactococcus raffinolactis]|uniref:phage tail tape measure protein n=1 Tax=Pseudolactococcus raffinolactis TaxID=1366 RepID=UPI00077BF406|nr:phage tail tape measure protein [Lactococcus raffinolactis]PCS11368.1 hypothetical protein RU88_GL000242 [Lactococcus raffinolactis]
MAGFIELATLKASVVADNKGFKSAMAAVKKEGKLTAEEVEKGFKESSKNTAAAMEAASKNIQKSLNMTEKDVKELTKSAENIYKNGFGKSANDVVKSLVQTKRALGDVDSKELETATKRALELRDTMGVKMSTTLKMAKREMEMYGSSADQAFDRVKKNLDQNAAAWEKVGKLGEKTETLGKALTVGLTVPVIGLGTAVGKMASDFESANARVVSSLGLTEQQSAVTKQAIQGIYSDGFGESIDDVAESLIQVKRQLGDIPDNQIKKVTENAMVLRDTLGQDMGESLRGVNSLMVNFGLSADDAMDLYVKGVQTGLDKTGELGDNLAEYGQLWSQAGFNAKGMFAVLDNGLKSGAYNLDKVNDFVKEFAISLNDGRIEKNLSSFSQGTRDVFSEFKNGNRTSQDVFKSIISDLESTTNQQDKLSLASTVWSALGEDNAMKIIESLNDVNGTYDNVAGSMEKVKQQQNETFGARAKSTFREAQTALLPLGEALIDIAEKYMPQLQKSVKSLSDTLSKLSADDIDRILKIGGIVAIAGPTVVGLTKITKGISTVGGALRIGAGAMGLFESSAAAAGGAAGIGGLGASLVALAGPAAIAVGATAIVAGGIWAINEAYKASQATNWGDDVTKAQKNVLDKTETLVNDTETKLTAYKNSYSTASKDIVQNLKDIEDGIKKANKKDEKDTADGIELLPIHMQKQAKELAEKQKQLNEEQEAQVSASTQRVSDIMNNARQNERHLTEAEKGIILGITKSLSVEQVEALGLGAQQKIKMLEDTSKTVEEMNGKERKAYIKSLDEIATQEDDSYKKRIKAVEVFGKNSQQYQEVEKNHQEAMIEIYAKRVSAFKGDINQKDALIAEYAQKAGVSVSEFRAKMSDLDNSMSEKMKTISTLISKAGLEWSNLELDPKTGELTVKGREQLMDALFKAGQWDSMTLEEKKASLNVDDEKIVNSIKSINDYNDYNIITKDLMINDSDLIAKMINSELNLNNYKSMNPEEKQFVANNTDLINKVLTGKGSVEEFNQYPALMKLFNGVDATGQPVAFAKENINKFNTTETPTKQLNAQDNTTVPATNAWEAINKIPNSKTTKLEADTGGFTTSINNMINNLGSAAKKALGFANGSPGLPFGQFALVNDQKGALYEELITLPNGFSFIPKGRDVMLPLPKNTRIDKASDTEKIKRGLPHFADGLNNQQPLPFIGYNATFKPTSVSRVDTSSSVLDPGTSKVIQLLQLIYEKDMDVILNGKSVLDYFEKEMTRRSRV